MLFPSNSTIRFDLENLANICFLDKNKYEISPEKWANESDEKYNENIKLAQLILASNDKKTYTAFTQENFLRKKYNKYI